MMPEFSVCQVGWCQGRGWRLWVPWSLHLILCNGCSRTRSLVWVLPAKQRFPNLVVPQNSCCFSCYIMSNSFATPWTVEGQVPLSTGFPRQEYWSGLPFPPPGDLPNSGIEPGSPALVGRFFTIWATREEVQNMESVLKTWQETNWWKKKNKNLGKVKKIRSLYLNSM